MQVLEFEVREQEIFRLGPDYVASNTINFLKCKFSFDASWDRLIRHASFSTDLTAAATVLLDELDECIVPSWLIAEPTQLHIAAIGFDLDDNIQATTHYTSVEVHLGAITNTAEPPPDAADNYYTKTEIDMLLAGLNDDGMGAIPIGPEPPAEGSQGDLFFDTDNE